MRIALTDLSIRKLNPPDRGQLKVWDTKLPGFGVIVGKTAKTFTVVYGKERRNQSIGRYPDISLSEARSEAKRLLASKPIKQRLTSLSAARGAYLEHCQAKNRESTIHEYRRMLDLIPDKPLDQISKHDLKQPTSHQVMCWRIFFNWCIRNELVEKNPFLHIPTSVNKRSRVLSPEEIKAIWHYEWQPFTDILKLLLLTGQRRNQIWKLQPEWIDGEYIHFPADVMKSGRQHTIYLPKSAHQYLSGVPYSFNGWSKCKARMDRETGVTDWTIHDLRRTFATIHAQLGTPIHVIEAHLDHSSGTVSGVAAIYIRHNFLEEAKKPMEAYAHHIRQIII